MASFSPHSTALSSAHRWVSTASILAEWMAGVLARHLTKPWRSLRSRRKVGAAGPRAAIFIHGRIVVSSIRTRWIFLCGLATLAGHRLSGVPWPAELPARSSSGPDCQCPQDNANVTSDNMWAALAGRVEVGRRGRPHPMRFDTCPPLPTVFRRPQTPKSRERIPVRTFEPEAWAGPSARMPASTIAGTNPSGPLRHPQTRAR